MAETEGNENLSCYEFDAPSHVMDLKTLNGADNADNWFAAVTASSPPSNIVKSWGGQVPTQKTCLKKVPAQPPLPTRRVSKRKEAAVQGEVAGAMVVPPIKKQRRTHPSQQSTTNPCRSSRTIATPSSNTHLHSTEEKELKIIRNLQKEVAEHRKKNEASYKAALAGNHHPPKKLVLSATIPKEFHFTTDTRVKASAVSSDVQKGVDFRAQLRKHPSSPARAPKATVPKPFNLSTGNKRKAGEPAVYVPMAQQIEQFQRRTPDRYHLRSRQSQEKGPSPMKSGQMKITLPHTPRLLTLHRSRPTTVKSSAELEQEESEKQHKFRFKALELNRKILENALNPKKPATKEPTRSEAFELQVEKRLQQRQATKKPREEEKSVTFHSRPLPTRILEEVVGVPEKKVIHATVPESPAFVLNKRVRLDHKVEEVKPPSSVKSHPVPHFGLPFQPRPAEKTQVEVCPFSFEERERERRALKEKKLEELRNEALPKFKAQPLPDFHEVVLPEKKVVGSTKPEPFNLLINERGAVKNERWEQMVREEQKRQMDAAQFKARPNTVIHQEPFQPKKEIRTNLRPSTEVFQFSTERRAKERLEFERAASENEALRGQMEEEHRLEDEERQKEEITRLRQEQVHRAHPIRRYKPVELKKCDVALTIPQSPNFSDRFRL